MKDIVLYSILTFFSIYGFLAFLFFIIDFYFEIKYLKERDFYIFIKVKNEACKIEGILNSLLFKVFKNDIGIAGLKIIICDAGSDDGTYNILKSISEKEASVLITKKEELGFFIDKSL